jgi:hypothetical protein
MFPSRGFHQSLTGIIDAYAYDWLKRFRFHSIPGLPDNSSDRAYSAKTQLPGRD